ncbi:MAG: universal stress protein [Nocardioides sp.]|uniref:universal stress protein n=1 Tax=Nocardioides sp. TaxID=35761 RepID=UPI0039E5CFFB
MGSERSVFELGRDGPRTIVVGVDGSTSSMRAGAYAAGLARRQSSELVVVFARHIGLDAAVAPEAAIPSAMEAQDAVEAELRASLWQAPWAVEARLEVRRGHPKEVLAAVATETTAGLIVLGSSRAAAYLRPGGPLPVQLMRMRRWPVSVVP